jgi:hypothetical protein
VHLSSADTIHVTRPSNFVIKSGEVTVHATKAYGGVEAQLHTFYTSTLSGVSGQLQALGRYLGAH